MIAISLLLFILLILNLTKSNHDIDYNVGKYNVEEKFKKDHYIIKINKGKSTYVYTINNKMNKKKKIIRDIISINNNDLKCIVPKYKRKLDSEIYCYIDGRQVTKDYLIETENIDFIEMENKLKKNNIKISKSKEKQSTYKKLNIYQNNFNDKEKIILWDYKGIYIIGNDSAKYQKILKKDLYDNLMSTVVDKYYVLFENTSVNGIENVYYYDITKNKLKKFKLKNKISKKSYINGVADGLIYVTDKENKKQYTIDVKKEKIVEVDNGQTEYIIYKNNKKETLNKSDFLMKEQYFNDYPIDNEKIDYDEIKEVGEYYYFVKKGDFYKAIKGYEEYPTLLFHLFDVKEWFVLNNKVYITRQDCIYTYNEGKGLQKKIQYNELRYNYKNIYKVWEK